MNNSARKVIPIHTNDESAVRTGSVVSIDSEGISINLAGEIKTAKKAFSCIIDLEPADLII